MKILSPSLLSANFLNLEKDIKMLNESDAQWFHLDIMDGMFVPNISYGFTLLKPIRESTTKVLDVHLMIEKPERYIDRFIKAGADNITVHYEATTNLHAILGTVKSAGLKAGVAINPHTPISLLEEVVEFADILMIMSVNPGFGGQIFIENSIDKVVRLKKMINDRNLNTLIEIDGGISVNNAGLVYDKGVDIIVAGNAVFNSEDPKATIKEILSK